jgi:hypothetical protein
MDARRPGLLPIRGLPDGNSRPQNVGRDDAPLNVCSWANASSRLSGSQPRLAQAQGPAAASPSQPRPCPARARREAPQWIDRYAAALCGPFRADHATDPAAGSLAENTGRGVGRDMLTVLDLRYDAVLVAENLNGIPPHPRDQGSGRSEF